MNFPKVKPFQLVSDRKNVKTAGPPITNTCSSTAGPIYNQGVARRRQERRRATPAPMGRAPVWISSCGSVAMARPLYPRRLRHHGQLAGGLLRLEHLLDVLQIVG